MDRELVLAILGALLTGLTLQVASLWPTAKPAVCVSRSPRRAEHRCWWQVWKPLAPMIAVLCGLAGWAVLEPSNAERVPRTLLVLALPCAFVWLRAVSRAVKALTRRPVVRTAGVLGLWRPRIVISDRFRACVDAQAIAAAEAHEAAHVRHRDPLRLWLAQFATDLQWPSPRAADRLCAWMRVVECARDDEARRAGVEGADLAAAIIAAVRLQDAHRAATALIGDPIDFETRIKRLLVPPPTDDDVPRSASRFVVASAPALIAVALIGALCGEWVVRTVFSALP